MQLKFCTNCGDKHLLTAKFCGNCGEAFAANTVQSGTQGQAPVTKPTPQPAPSRKQTYVFDTARKEELTPEDVNGTSAAEVAAELDEEFNNGFLNLVMKNNKEAKPKGVKFGDVAGQSKENRSALGRRKATTPKNGKSILSSTKNKRKFED